MSSGKTLYFFIRHIGNMITSGGKKRIVYALVNIFFDGIGYSVGLRLRSFHHHFRRNQFFRKLNGAYFSCCLYNILFYPGLSGAGDSGRRRFHRHVPRRGARRQYRLLYYRAFVSFRAYRRLYNSTLTGLFLPFLSGQAVSVYKKISDCRFSYPLNTVAIKTMRL